MQGYLFPTDRKGLENPYSEFLNGILPNVKHSIFLIVPSPNDDLIEALADQVPPQIAKRVLIRRDLLNIGDSTPPDILKPKTRKLIQDKNIEVRAINRLSACIMIADDRALIISGEPGQLSWGIELNAVDSQPVIDYWETQYKDAARISETHALELWDTYQEKFWQDSVNPADIVAMYNQRGSFIDIQVRIFQGYRQMTLYPFESTNGPKGPVVRWRLIDSNHYQQLGRQAAKIHGLKSLSIIRDTAAGSYLRRRDVSSWNRMFLERNTEFRGFAGEYLDKHYDTMRQEALTDLLNEFRLAFTKVQESHPLLPILNEEFVEEQAHEVHLKNFPTKETLHFACQARYILFGLHPDAAIDRVLMESLSASAVSDILL